VLTLLLGLWEVLRQRVEVERRAAQAEVKTGTGCHGVARARPRVRIAVVVLVPAATVAHACAERAAAAHVGLQLRASVARPVEESYGEVGGSGEVEQADLNARDVLRRVREGAELYTAAVLEVTGGEAEL
jgi:hypothetical protein